MALGDIIERRENLEAARIEEFIDDTLAACAFRGIRSRSKFPGQKTRCEGEVGDDANLLFQAERLEFRFVFGARIKIVVRLQDLVSRQRAFAAYLQCLRQTRDR